MSCGEPMNEKLISSDHRMPVLFWAVFVSVLIVTPLTGGPSAWNQESGAIEVLSFLFWMLCPILFLWLFDKRAWLLYPHMVSLTLLLAFREAPFDVWIVDERLLQPGFYAAEGFTFDAILGGAIAVFVLASVAALFVFGFPAMWRAMRAGRSWPKLLILGGVFAAVGQVFEELMQPIAAVIGPWATVVSEELCELMFVVLVVAAILSAARARSL